MKAGKAGAKSKQEVAGEEQDKASLKKKRKSTASACVE